MMRLHVHVACARARARACCMCTCMWHVACGMWHVACGMCVCVCVCMRMRMCMCMCMCMCMSTCMASYSTTNARAHLFPLTRVHVSSCAVIIFHDFLTPVHTAELEAVAEGGGPLSFEPLDSALFSLPPSFPTSQRAEVPRAVRGYGMGYRHMCRALAAVRTPPFAPASPRAETR